MADRLSAAVDRAPFGVGLDPGDPLLEDRLLVGHKWDHQAAFKVSEAELAVLQHLHQPVVETKADPLVPRRDELGAGAHIVECAPAAYLGDDYAVRGRHGAYFPGHRPDQPALGLQVDHSGQAVTLDQRVPGIGKQLYHIEFWLDGPGPIELDQSPFATLGRDIELAAGRPQVSNCGATAQVASSRASPHLP